MYKIISISNQFPDVETTSFNSNISLTDFDIVIVDPTVVMHSFPESDIRRDNKRYVEEKSAHILSELIERRKSEFSALLNNGRMIVSFLNPLYDVRLVSTSIKNVSVNNYSWLPDDDKRRFTNRLIEGTGAGLKLVEKNHLFAPYFLAFQKDLTFQAYIDIPVQSFELGNVFISNSADLVVGFSLKILKGIVVFLPGFKYSDENNRKFMGVLLSIVKNYFGSEVKSPPPDWTSIFTVPGMDVLEKNILEIEKEISEFETRKSEIGKALNNLNDYKSLLYEQGHVLEKKVLDALSLIGFKAETIPGENTDFDVILESEEGRAIAEVEGKDDNSVHKDKIDQLLSAINQDAEKRDIFAKGVLIGNHYRLKTLDQRGEPFTKAVISLAKQYHYALVTTVDLYNATIYFLQHPEDEDCKKACRKAIFESDGAIVKFPIP